MSYAAFFKNKGFLFIEKLHDFNEFEMDNGNVEFV